MTKFAIIMISQVRENYAFTEEGDLDMENPYWKNKGGHETVLMENLTPNEVVELTRGNQIDKMCQQHKDYNLRNGIIELDYTEYQIVSIDDDLVEKVKAAAPDLVNGDKISAIGLSYAANITEYEAKAAIKLLAYESCL